METEEKLDYTGLDDFGEPIPGLGPVPAGSDGPAQWSGGSPDVNARAMGEAGSTGTGEDGRGMSAEEAQEVTDTIRASSQAIHDLLRKAHEGRAHVALGYSTWGSYVKGEFDMSAQRSYQLIDLSKAISAFEGAAPSGTKVKLTEAAARDIKADMEALTARVCEETEGLEEASDVVSGIVADARREKREARSRSAEQEADRARAGVSSTVPVELADDDSEGQLLEDLADDFLKDNGVDPGTGRSARNDGWRAEPPAGDARVPNGTPASVRTAVQILSMVAYMPSVDSFVDDAAGLPRGELNDLHRSIIGASKWFDDAEERIAAIL